MLTLHRGVPVDYRALLPFLITPAIWAQKGSIPGLVALLRAFLARDAAAMVEANQHTSVLGIVQQRLVPSKVNDGWGFELLQSVVLHVPLCVFRTATTAASTKCICQACAATVFPPDRHDAAHADAAEQDEQLCLLLCVLPSVSARDQHRGPHPGLSHPNRR